MHTQHSTNNLHHAFDRFLLCSIGIKKRQSEELSEELSEEASEENRPNEC